MRAEVGRSGTPTSCRWMIACALARVRRLSPTSGRGVGAISAEVTALLEGVLKTMFLTQLKKAAAVVLLAVGIIGGTGMLLHHVLADEPATGRGQVAAHIRSTR